MKKILLSFLFPTLPVLAFCCSCIGYTSFCELINPDTKVANVRIINGYFWPTTVDDRKFWIDVVVEETLQGDIQTDTMTILASSGTSCDPGIESFEIGKQLIVHLNESQPNGPTQWFTFRFENTCREDFLKLENGRVSGFIKENFTDIAYTEFKQQLGSCVNYTRTYDKPELERSFILFPNPSAVTAYLYSQHPISNYKLEIYNAIGQLMLSETVNNESKHPLLVGDFASGVYFVKIQVGEEFIVKRLAVQG